MSKNNWIDPVRVACSNPIEPKMIAARIGVALMLFMAMDRIASAHDPDANEFMADSTGTTKNQPIPSNAASAPLPDIPVPNVAILPLGAAAAGTDVPADPYYNYRWKGIIVNLPPPSGTIGQGLGGLRQKLADKYGIGYFGYSVDTFYDNVLHAAHSLNHAQAFAGQKATGLSQNSLIVTIDLDRYGISNGQIVISGIDQAVSWNPLGPNVIGFNTLSYFQSLFNKRLDVKIGLIGESFEFIGSLTAGSLSGGIFGSSANLQTEAGQSGQAFPTYAVNVTAHVTKYFYDKVGIGRALNPDGTVTEHNYNHIGVNFKTVNTGLWLINEAGYLRPAAPHQTKLWIRLGPILSESRYVELDHPAFRGNNNYALYALVDQQVLQTSGKRGESFRGLYAGFSAEYAPPSYNRFSQYYEVRVYGLGLLPGRPHDQVSLVATDIEFSKESINAYRRAHQLTHDDTQSLTLSYSAQVFPGFFLNGAVGYTDNPTPIVYNGNTGSDLNAIVGLTIFL